MNTDTPLDLTGLKCPMPIVKLSGHIKELNAGDEFSVIADDPAFCLDVHAWCRSTGNELVREESSPDHQLAVIRKK